MAGKLFVTCSVKTRWYFVPSFFIAALLLKARMIGVEKATAFVMKSVRVDVEPV